MVNSIVKRKIGNKNLGRLTKRRSGTNVKNNLLKDIYNLYSLGEGSIESLPKHMIRSDTKFQHQEVQTDSCLSNTLFASKAEAEAVKNDLLNKLSDLREEFVASNCPIQTNPVQSSQLSLSVTPTNASTQTERSSLNESGQ